MPGGDEEAELTLSQKSTQHIPSLYWSEVARELHWYREWSEVLDASEAPYYQWFKDGLTNACYNEVDRHVANTNPAFIVEPLNADAHVKSYLELFLDACACQRFMAEHLQLTVAHHTPTSYDIMNQP